MKVLLTGASGFIGRKLTERLTYERDKFDLICMGRRPVINFKDYLGEPIKYYACDLGESNIESPDYYIFDKVCSEHKPDVIFHLAGYPTSKLDEINRHKVVMDNIVGTQKVIHYAPEGCRIVLASSVVVYGDWFEEFFETGKYYEDDKTVPTSVYGASKVACESLLNIYHNMDRVSGVSLRLCATVGDGVTHGVLKDFIRKLNEDEKSLQVLGDQPGSVKPFCHISDVVNAFVFAATSDMSGVYNVVSDDTASVEEIAHAVMDVCNIHKPIEWLGEKANWKGDNKLVSVDNSKLKETGFEMKYPKSIDAIKKAVSEMI